MYIQNLDDPKDVVPLNLVEMEPRAFTFMVTFFDVAGRLRIGHNDLRCVVPSCGLGKKHKPGESMQRVLQFTTLLILAVWWGGLTFYAAIVVPIGSDVFGATQQGFVTQSVTNRLNGLLGITLAVSVWSIIVIRRPLQISAWFVLLATLIAVIGLHRQLDRMLDPHTMSVADSARFYAVHRIYLWITIVQWLAGIICFWCLLFPCVTDGTRDENPI